MTSNHSKLKECRIFALRDLLSLFLYRKNCRDGIPSIDINYNVNVLYGSIIHWGWFGVEDHFESSQISFSFFVTSAQKITALYLGLQELFLSFILKNFFHCCFILFCLDLRKSVVKSEIFLQFVRNNNLYIVISFTCSLLDSLNLCNFSSHPKWFFLFSILRNFLFSFVLFCSSDKRFENQPRASTFFRMTSENTCDASKTFLHIDVCPSFLLLL